MSAVRVSAERDRCVGAGMCLVSAPDVFDQDDDGLVVLLAQDVPDGAEDAARRAVAHCPSGALRVEQD